MDKIKENENLSTPLDPKTPWIPEKKSKWDRNKYDREQSVPPSKTLPGAPSKIETTSNALFKNLVEVSEKLKEYQKTIDQKNLIEDFQAEAALIRSKTEDVAKHFYYDEDSFFEASEDNETEGHEDSWGKKTDLRKRHTQAIGDLVDISMQNIFLKQLEIIKERALNKFISELAEEQNPNEFSVFSTDSFFVSEAEKILLSGSNWSYAKERASLQRIMQDMSKRKKLLIAEKIKSGEQQAYSFQLLQQQQATMHSIQQQQYGGTPTMWNIGIAYRPPDSIFNISAGYQQGKANIQITMIPDEQASLLGSTGFTAGVGPGNLGLTLNLNI